MKISIEEVKKRVESFTIDGKPLQLISYTTARKPIEILCPIYGPYTVSTADKFFKRGTLHPSARQDNKRKTCLAKYGVDNPAKSKQVQEKTAKTNLEKYGTEHHIAAKAVRDKIRSTMLDRYGVENAAFLESTQDKKRKTCQEKYGVPVSSMAQLVKDKAEANNMKKYGFKSSAMVPEVRDRYKATCMKRFGNEYAIASEMVRETIIRRYGALPYQSPKLLKKMQDSKRANGTFNSSNPEKECLEYLKKTYPKTKDNYSSSKYPFLCDAYVPELDTYIEFNFHWTHGPHPYDPAVDVFDLCNWVKIAAVQLLYKKSYYDNAVSVWTKRDPLKRKTAKENDLSYLEFFTKEEFLEWICE